MKIRTEIHKPNDIISRKLKVIGNTIEVRKGAKGKGNAGYYPKFTKASIVHYRKKIFPIIPLYALKQKLMLIDGADECITLRYEEKEEPNIPVWTREAEEKLFEANVLKASGSITQKIEVPFILYALLLGLTMISFLTLLVASGRLRI